MPIIPYNTELSEIHPDQVCTYEGHHTPIDERTHKNKECHKLHHLEKIGLVKTFRCYN